MSFFLNKFHFDLNEDQLSEFFELFDIDENGEISIKEFFLIFEKKRNENQQ
jgi:Ca2+-binding EF-hand superfamily protein